MKLSDLWPLAKETISQFLKDKGPRLGAAIAFYAALSLSPMLLVLVSLAGAIYGEQAARGELTHQIQDMVGDQAAESIQSLLAQQHSSGGGTLMTVVGIIALLVGATGMFAELQDALNTVWNIKAERIPGGIWGVVRSRLLAFVVICGLAFLLVVSLIVGACLSSLSSWMESHLGTNGWGLRIANQALSFLLTGVLFAFIFKVLPQVRPAWSDIWIGAGITAVLFMLGKFLIGLYLSQAAPGSAYGAAGSFVVLLAWLYYSTQILLLGAEFTQVYADRLGSGLKS